MAKHTPGPWTQLDGMWVVGHGGRTVCTMAEAKTNNDEMEPNARLIAAAPELLEALEAVTVAAKIEGLDAKPGWENLLESTRAAIAKAKGNRDDL